MKYLGIFIVGLFVGFFVFHKENPNAKATYGAGTGLPKNCRAIVAENYKGYVNKEFSADGALDSINRNCGEFGHAWEN